MHIHSLAWRQDCYAAFASFRSPTTGMPLTTHTRDCQGSHSGMHCTFPSLYGSCRGISTTITRRICLCTGGYTRLFHNLLARILHPTAPAQRHCICHSSMQPFYVVSATKVLLSAILKVLFHYLMLVSLTITMVWLLKFTLVIMRFGDFL